MTCGARGSSKASSSFGPLLLSLCARALSLSSALFETPSSVSFSSSITSACSLGISVHRAGGMTFGTKSRDRKTKEPVPESLVAAVVADCMEQGVLIGKTNRCFDTLNNNIYITPPLMSTADDIDLIVSAMETAMARANSRMAAGRTG